MPNESQSDLILGHDFSEVIALRDQDGNVYLLPRTTVDSAKVPERYRAAVEQVLGGSDVMAFGVPTWSVGAVSLTSLIQGLGPTAVADVQRAGSWDSTLRAGQ